MPRQQDWTMQAAAPHPMTVISLQKGLTLQSQTQGLSQGCVHWMRLASCCCAALPDPSLLFCAVLQVSPASTGMKTNDEVHRDARVCAVKCYYKADGVISDAMDAFQEQWNAQHPEHTISDTRSFIQLSVSKLEVSHTLHDAVGHGRPKLLSDDDAVKCADIVAEGYMQQQVVTEEGVSHEYEELKQFTSLSDALQMSARLRALTTDKGLKPEYVERRLHDVAPWLKYGVLPMKLPLSVDVMEARLQYCGMMLKFIEEDPDFLKRVFWYDECRIWFNMDLAGKLKVWYDRRKLAGQPPEENPMFELHGARRIDFALILNARLGCVYVEFLTGTTDIDTMGRHNPGMREHMERRKDFELARIEAVGDIEKKKGTGCYRVSQMWHCTAASYLYSAPVSTAVSHSQHVCCCAASTTMSAYSLLSVTNLAACNLVAASIA